jgi:hypothetical protein
MRLIVGLGPTITPIPADNASKNLFGRLKLMLVVCGGGKKMIAKSNLHRKDVTLSGVTAGQKNTLEEVPDN